ncbi:MAG TPA: FliI/YscN family ATPase [bacterium]|nr:FliI/YscN family ATPase [bacterium]
MFETHPVAWQNLESSVDDLHTIRLRGRIEEVVGLLTLSRGPGGSIGDLVFIYPGGNHPPIPAEIVGFRAGRVILMPLGPALGVYPGAEVISTGAPMRIRCGPEMLGRVIDGVGYPIDGKGTMITDEWRSIIARPPSAIARRRITTPLATGIKALDGFLTWGRGQRIGVFSGSGVGKSTLMGMIARNTEAEVNVIALIGERGREVREFLEKDLGEDGLKRSVVIVVTSDNPALLRVKGAFAAITVAEFFRDQGKDVMFMMDSVTRLAMAQREVGLAAGEPPTTRGYTPSVFAMLPGFLERAGTSIDEGSITGLFTVLVEGDDMNEPVADAVRGILDGHVVLSRKLATRSHYPAIDVQQSISRLMVDIVPEDHYLAARRLVQVISVYRDSEDLINIGAYQKGSSPEIDLSIQMIGPIEEFLRQPIRQEISYEEVIKQVKVLAAKAGLK